MDAKVLMQRTQSLNLEPITVKLIDQKDGEGWSLQRAEIAVDEYRKFLFLVGLSMNDPSAGPVVPWGGVDKVWHTHILDTAKYQKDCDVLFGQFLHHFPYYGMRGEEDRQNLVQSAKDTLTQVIKHFGEFLDGMHPYRQVPDTCTGAWCGGTLTTDNQKIKSSERPSLTVWEDGVSEQGALRCTLFYAKNIIWMLISKNL